LNGEQISTAEPASPKPPDGITEELLDTGRPKASPRRGRPLSAILDRTLHLLSHHPGFGRIEVDRRFAAGLPDVEVDEEAIVQVFVALIRNAVDAMPEGGRLTVEAVAIGEEVRCDVRDDGCGIAPSDLPHVFEPFFTTKPPGRGTGLGLSVCYGILKSHGGKIEVDSKPGQGASFRLTLPACSTAGAVVDEARSCKPPTFGS
jgi:signal transduction histidine kinase